MATGFRGAIFDVDGVLVDSPHERAWRDALKELMETQWSDVQPQTSYSPERFTPQVYQQVMSGKPRFSGAQAALEYFDVPDAETRSRTYGDRKQSMVIELIEAGEFTAYPDALRFVIAVKDAGIRVAAASSSKNAGLFLRQIRLDTFAQENGLESEQVTPALTLLEFFDADISGRDFARGKPHPEIFLTGPASSVCHPRNASSSRTRSPASRRPRREGWPRSAYRAPTTRTSSAPPSPTCWSPPWMTSTSRLCGKGAWRGGPPSASYRNVLPGRPSPGVRRGRPACRGEPIGVTHGQADGRLLHAR